MRTSRLFALALVTTLVGVIPWLVGASTAVKLFGSVLTAFALLIAFLTGSVMITERRTNGCGECDTCTCLIGKDSKTDAATATSA